jgi:ankyrin repeat protein
MDGWTALMFASRSSNKDSSIETVKLLIDSGAYLNLQDVDGWTALISASRYSNTDSSIETVKLLIDSGADINIMTFHGDTCLSYLVRYSNSLDIIKTVISKNVIINNLTHSALKYNGNSILHWCSIGIKENTSNHDILTCLETLDIDKTLKNCEGKTYLDYLEISYYVSTTCEICYNDNGLITVLNCRCNCARQCIRCTNKLDKCCYCKTLFTGYEIILIK